MKYNWLERTELLMGKESLERVRNASVCVVGLGGVGAYAAEMIARAGVSVCVFCECVMAAAVRAGYVCSERFAFCFHGCLLVCETSPTVVVGEVCLC